MRLPSSHLWAGTNMSLVCDYCCNLAFADDHHAYTVETVEPGNDRSLESWTNCPVSLILKFCSDYTLYSGLSGV
jgi:hypothetical protein